MRLPYTPNPPPPSGNFEAAVIARITARRAPRPLQELDLALLHSPPVADGWNSFLGAIRSQTSLQPDIRELAICRVAALNGAKYEWEHHAPLAREGGLGEESMNRIAGQEVASKAGTDGLSEKQWAVMRYTDAMTKDIKVSEEVFSELKHFDDKGIVEITATVRFV
jgi:alkylhydroperoxidase family enzyme